MQAGWAHLGRSADCAVKALKLARQCRLAAFRGTNTLLLLCAHHSHAGT
jgi:hypothetical protein